MYNEKLERLTTEELIVIAEDSLVFQILMIRRAPILIMKLDIRKKGYKEKRNKYANLVIDLGDNIHNLPFHIEQSNRKGLLFELSRNIEFFTEIQKNKALLIELDAYQIIKLYNDNGLLNSL